MFSCSRAVRSVKILLSPQQYCGHDGCGVVVNRRFGIKAGGVQVQDEQVDQRTQFLSPYLYTNSRCIV